MPAIYLSVQISIHTNSSTFSKRLQKFSLLQNLKIPEKVRKETLMFLILIFFKVMASITLKNACEKNKVKKLLIMKENFKVQQRHMKNV